MLILVIQQHSQFSVVQLAWKCVLSTAKQLPITLQSEIQGYQHVTSPNRLLHIL